VKVAKLNDRQWLFASPQAGGDTQRGAHAIANGIDLAGHADKAAALIFLHILESRTER
jgi:hypothetical protein